MFCRRVLHNLGICPFLFSRGRQNEARGGSLLFGKLSPRGGDARKTNLTRPPPRPPPSLFSLLKQAGYPKLEMKNHQLRKGIIYFLTHQTLSAVMGAQDLLNKNDLTFHQ